MFINRYIKNETYRKCYSFKSITKKKLDPLETKFYCVRPRIPTAPDNPDDTGAHPIQPPYPTESSECHTQSNFISLLPPSEW